MAHFLSLVSVDDVIAFTKQFQPLNSEDIPLADALNRILVTPFLAPADLPGFARSTMDGFAVQAKDVFGASEGLPALLKLVGECPMGETPPFTLNRGQTARICTGGMLPQGADAVVMLEYAKTISPTVVELTKPVAPGDHVVAANEDATKGDVLIQAGKKLRSYELGFFAAFGCENITVRKRPKVAIISTGDEVIPVATTPKAGQIRDVNSTTLTSFATQLGAQAKAFALVPDKPDALHKALEQALAWGDIIIISGGSSAGQRDYTLSTINKIPAVSVFCHGVAISPGKPLIVARTQTKSIWGYPGHVASALVCAYVFLQPLIHTLLNQEPEPSFLLGHKAQLTRPVSSAQGRRDYIRVALEPPLQAGQPLRARPLLGKSGLISTLVQANALVICPESEEGLYENQLVDIYLLP